MNVKCRKAAGQRGVQRASCQSHSQCQAGARRAPTPPVTPPSRPPLCKPQEVQGLGPQPCRPGAQSPRRNMTPTPGAAQGTGGRCHEPSPGHSTSSPFLLSPTGTCLCPARLPRALGGSPGAQPSSATLQGSMACRARGGGLGCSGRWLWSCQGCPNPRPPPVLTMTHARSWAHKGP